MAWIKMRTNLATDGRVVAISRAVKAKPAVVLGALFLFWSLADEHSENGVLPGHDAASIDRAVGVKGFSVALNSVGWLAFVNDGVIIPRFEEHNGLSAKRRAESNRRVTEWRQEKRNRNAGVTQPPLQNPLPEERRGEKRREEPSAKPDGGRADPPTDHPSPIPLCDAEARIRRWTGDRLSASDRHAIAKAERDRTESPPVTIHGRDETAAALFTRAIDEAIASGADFRSAGGFLKLVGTIEARCARQGCWPGEGLERTNGHAREPTTAELIAADKARRAKL